MENNNSENGSQAETTQTEVSEESVQAPAETGVDSAQEERQEAEFRGMPVKPIVAHFVAHTNTLLVDLGQIFQIGARENEVTMAEAMATPVPTQPARKQPRSVVSPRQVHQNSGGKALPSGQKVHIHAPPAGLVVRADETLMLRINEDNSADILQTENWVYPEGSVTPGSIQIKAKNSASFLSFQDPIQGFRVGWAIKHDTGEVLKIVKHGKFLPKNIVPLLERGFTEFLYSTQHVSKFFRLPTGAIVTCKKQLDLSPEDAVQVAKKQQQRQESQVTVASITGTLSGVMT